MFSTASRIDEALLREGRVVFDLERGRLDVGVPEDVDDERLLNSLIPIFLAGPASTRPSMAVQVSWIVALASSIFSRSGGCWFA